MSEAAAALSGDPGSNAPAEGQAPAESQGAWYDGFSDDLKNIAVDRQWAGPEAVVESYRNLEKLTGAPPDRLLKLPKSDAPAEEWNSVWDRLGRPESPEGYGFQAEEGTDSTLMDWAGKTFHELGLPKAAAEKLLGKYAELEQTMIANETAAYQERTAKEAATLRKEWGAAFDQNAGLAKAAAVKLGIDANTIDGLERVLGFEGVMKLFHNIGNRTGESDFVSSGAGSGPQTGVMTPSAAKARIAALRSDAGFVGRYTANDAGAIDEMRKLHEWAYPE